MKTILELQISGNASFIYRNINVSMLKETLIKLLVENKKRAGIVSLVILNDDELREVNKKTLHHDYYTDIITFDYTDKLFHVETELLISNTRIKENAKTFKTLVGLELLRVIIHGVLHVCGYNDKKKKEKEEMTKQENRYLDLYKAYGKI